MSGWEFSATKPGDTVTVYCDNEVLWTGTIEEPD